MNKGHMMAPIEMVQSLLDKVNNGIDVSDIPSLKDIAVPLLVDNWVFDETDNVYTYTSTINGLTEESNPIILLSSVNEEASTDELNAYKCITEANINEGSITFVADEKPAIGITLIVKNVVASDSTAIEDITNLVNKVNELESGLKTLNSDLGTKLTMSGTYTPEMTLNDVYASMSNNTFFTFTAENGSVIRTELGLNSSRGIRFFISREHQWRGFAIGSVNGANSRIYIANVTGENVMTMHEISKKNDFIEYEFSASVEVKSGLTAENSTVVIPTGIPTSEKIVSATLTSGNSVIPMWLADVNYVGATIGFTNPWNVNRITTCKLIVTTRRIYY